MPVKMTATQVLKEQLAKLKGEPMATKEPVAEIKLGGVKFGVSSAEEMIKLIEALKSSPKLMVAAAGPLGLTSAYKKFTDEIADEMSALGEQAGQAGDYAGLFGTSLQKMILEGVKVAEEDQKKKKKLAYKAAMAHKQKKVASNADAQSWLASALDNPPPLTKEESEHLVVGGGAYEHLTPYKKGTPAHAIKNDAWTALIKEESKPASLGWGVSKLFKNGTFYLENNPSEEVFRIELAINKESLYDNLTGKAPDPFLVELANDVLGVDESQAMVSKDHGVLALYMLYLISKKFLNELGYDL